MRVKIKKLTKQQKIDLTKGAAPYLIAFVISTVIGLILYKVKNIMPFGDQSILCMDLWGQYFPMYVQNAEADSIQDMLYSWNGAFGYNNWAQNAYYCNSIFWLIFKFLPVGKLVAALNWISLLKISLSCQLSCISKIQDQGKIPPPDSRSCLLQPVRLYAGVLLSVYVDGFPDIRAACAYRT